MLFTKLTQNGSQTKYKTQNYKPLEDNTEENTGDVGHGRAILDMTPRHGP